MLPYAQILGKGNKERKVYFAPDAWQAIQSYLAVRDALGLTYPEGSNRQDEPVFSVHSKKSGSHIGPMDPQDVRRVFRRLLRAASASLGGKSVAVTPHQLRHYFATLVQDTIGDIKVTQLLLGHAQASTTANIYVHTDEQRAQRAYREVFVKRDV
jgi:site-specific recombinase XerD